MRRSSDRNRPPHPLHLIGRQKMMPTIPSKLNVSEVSSPVEPPLQLLNLLQHLSLNPSRPFPNQQKPSLPIFPLQKAPLSLHRLSSHSPPRHQYRRQPIPHPHHQHQRNLTTEESQLPISPSRRQTLRHSLTLTHRLRELVRRMNLLLSLMRMDLR